MFYKRLKSNYFILSFFYLLLNFLYYITGGKFFFWQNIRFYWQFLDINLLKRELLKSLFYLHSQPPLFNLFTGIILKIPFISPKLIAVGIFLIIGYLTIIFFYKILLLFDIRKDISLFLTLIFLFNPTFLMYETFYFYTLPVIFLLILSLFFLLKFLKGKKDKYGTYFLICLLIISLTRSIFHILFFIPLFFIFKDIEKKRRRKFYKNLTITILILFSFYLKNYILFNTFSLSSWFGMNFAKVFSLYMTKDEKKKLMKNNLDDVFYTIPPFAPYIYYPPRYLSVPKQYKNVPVLSKAYKEVSGCLFPNFNYYPYVVISKIYFKKYLKALFINPILYERGVLKSFEFYLYPAYFTHLIVTNSIFLKFMMRSYNFIYGIQPQNRVTMDRKFYYTKFEVFPFFLLFVLFTFPIFIFNLRLESKLWRRIALIFIFYVIVYVMYIGIFFECGENNRFRFITHAYYLIIWGLFFMNLNLLKEKISKLF